MEPKPIQTAMATTMATTMAHSNGHGNNLAVAAATATAMRAKEHEKQSAVMYSQQEELMKFQFMSMSLSYFSSLNMLKKHVLFEFEED